MLKDRLGSLVELDPVMQAREELGGEIPDPHVFFLRIHDDPVRVRREQVAHGPQGQGEFPVDEDGRARRLPLLPDGVPVADQVVHVRLQFALRFPLRGGADDGPHPVQADLFHDRVEPLPLLRVLDSPGDADVRGPGEEHEIPARKSDVGRDPRSLGPQRFLGHLNGEVLPLPDHPLDRGDVLLLRVPGHVKVDFLGEILVAVLVGVEVEPRSDEVACVEEPRLLHPDVHESGLHPRKDPDDPALVDVADDVPVVPALEEKLDEDAGLERRDTHLVRGGIDDDELASLLHLIPSGAEGVRSTASSPRSGGAKGRLPGSPPRRRAAGPLSRFHGRL